jgi:hypothetical protein
LAKDNDKDVLPEHKFAGFHNSCRMSIGYDRDRPFNINDDAFYVQQLSPDEFKYLKDNNLL